jgi:stage II sporulation protein D
VKAVALRLRPLVPLLLAAAPAFAAEQVRIAVAVDRPSLEVAGAGLGARPLADGAALRPLPAGRALLELRDGGLHLDGEPLDAAGVLLSADGPLRLEGKPVEGALEIRRGAAGLDAVLALPMEDYVAAVVEGEMPLSFPPEALKAQAVAARSFALAKKLEALAEGRSWHLGATVLHQVLGAGEDRRAREAARATAGEVLVRGHEPLAAYFHSVCGGRTERGADALGRDDPHLAPVPCGRCESAPRRRWTARVPAAELGRAAGLSRPVTSVRVVARSPTGRAARLSLAAGREAAVIAAADLRQRLGWERLPSLWFEASLSRGAVVFRGRGAGHGAGMCQWGAAGHARQGRAHAWILRHYYPGADVVRMY